MSQEQVSAQQVMQNRTLKIYDTALWFAHTQSRTGANGLHAFIVVSLCWSPSALLHCHTTKYDAVDKAAAGLLWYEDGQNWFLVTWHDDRTVARKTIPHSGNILDVFGRLVRLPRSLFIAHPC